jgi:endo-beta-N-acetylglucosaminidase D
LQDGAKALLQLLDHVDESVEKLVSIMTYYGFDGWLINIECSLPADAIPKLIRFVSAMFIESLSLS